MGSIDLSGILDVLANQDPLLGVFLAGAGLVFMAVGCRVHRSLVAISFGVLGFVVCSLVSGGDVTRLMLGLVGAIVLGAVSTHYTKPALILLSGRGRVTQPRSWPRILISRWAYSWGSVRWVSDSCFPGVHHAARGDRLRPDFEGTLLVIGAIVIFLNQKPCSVRICATCW
jgi:hypothetical protein